MNISEKARTHIDACRFCWMCRHICPIGNATGQERNTARARALGLSLVVRGAEKTEDVVDNIYECALCGACVKECVTGWDPVMFVQEAKTDAVLSGVIPAYIEKMLDAKDRTGNIYGAALAEDFPVREDSADTLLYLGQDARYKSAASCKNAAAVLDKAGVRFDCLKDEAESGYATWFLTGNTAETQEAAKACAAQLSRYKNVIAYDPADLSFIKRQYREWGIAVKAEVIGFSDFLLALIAEKKLNVRRSERAYTVQDSFHTARELENAESMRRLAALCGENRDMLCCGKDTFLAGSLIMNEYMPAAMREAARRRLESAKNIGAETVVTESPAEYEQLRALGDKTVRVLSAEEMVLENLK